MIKSVTFTLFIILVGFLLHMSIQERYKSVNSLPKDASHVNKSSFEKIQIKVYGKSGVEWLVKGNLLEMEKEWVKLEDPIFMSSKGEVVKASKATLNKFAGVGNLEGNVILESRDLYIQTDMANVDLKNSLMSGGGSVYVKDGNKVVRGKGYTVDLKHRRVIINNVYTEIR